MGELDFWESPTLDELAQVQHVQPMTGSRRRLTNCAIHV